MKTELEFLLKLVSDDNIAMSFQTLGGYRTHLKENIKMLLFASAEAAEQKDDECNLPVVKGCATLEEIEQAADKLTDDERLELIGRYCKYCGALDNTCQCWNDE